MSIYLAEETKGNLKPTPALERRGLNLRAVPMTRVDPVGAPEVRQTAYSIYKANLPAFLKAYATNSTLQTNQPGYRLRLPVDQLIPIPGPPLMAAFDAKLSDVEVEEMKNLGGEAIMFNKELAIVFRGGHLSGDFLRALTHHPKGLRATTPTPYGLANMTGYIEFLRCLAIATAFIRVQHYPAFQGPVEGLRPAGAFAEIKDVLRVLKRSAPEEAGGAKKKARMEVEGEDDESDLTEYEEAINMEEIVDIAIGGDTSSIPRANPPDEVKLGYGGPDEMPSYPGNVFPYFEDLLDDDYNYVTGVIREYFMECLGDERNEILSGYRSLKLGFGQFAPTAAGRILTHIFAGVRLAIMTQTTMHVFLQNGRYTGFSIHGYYYALSVAGRGYRPGSSEEVKELASSIDAHNEALDKIRGVCVTAVKKNTKEAKVLATKRNFRFSGPRELALFLERLSLSDDVMKEIAILCNDLSFPQNFWPFNPRNVLKVAEAIISGNELPEEAPMFCTGGVITSGDHAIRCMSVFGDHGFSFRCPNGKAILVPKTMKDTDIFNKIKDKKGKMIDPNVTLVIAKKPLRVACNDFDQFLNDHKWLNRDQRAAPFKNITVSGKESKEFFSALVDILPDLSGREDDKETAAPRKDIGGAPVASSSKISGDFF